MGWWWTEVFRKQLLEIKEADIKFVESNNADIAYWLHAGRFHTRKGDIGSRIKVVHFNHPKRYWKECLRDATHCVFQSQRYYDIYNIPNKSSISMGVDLKRFRPRIKIGVVACKQNRKNAELLFNVIEKARDFDFFITGPRWENDFEKFPNATYSKHILYEDMPRFYQAIDYLLVTSTSEGGPYPIIEALACNKPVISTDVGYVGEVDVIKYDSLDELLKILQNIKNQYRQQAFKYSTENFKRKHIELFRKLYESR